MVLVIEEELEFPICTPLQVYQVDLATGPKPVCDYGPMASCDCLLL